MSSNARLILTSAIVGGVCGIAGAALYVLWRGHRRPAGERASDVLRQLERVADRIQHALEHAPGPEQGARPTPTPALLRAHTD